MSPNQRQQELVYCETASSCRLQAQHVVLCRLDSQSQTLPNPGTLLAFELVFELRQHQFYLWIRPSSTDAYLIVAWKPVTSKWPYLIFRQPSLLCRTLCIRFISFSSQVVGPCWVGKALMIDLHFASPSRRDLGQFKSLLCVMSHSCCAVCNVVFLQIPYLYVSHLSFFQASAQIQLPRVLLGPSI